MRFPRYFYYAGALVAAEPFRLLPAMLFVPTAVCFCVWAFSFGAGSGGFFLGGDSFFGAAGFVFRAGPFGFAQACAFGASGVSFFCRFAAAVARSSLGLFLLPLGLPSFFFSFTAGGADSASRFFLGRPRFFFTGPAGSAFGVSPSPSIAAEGRVSSAEVASGDPVVSATHEASALVVGSMRRSRAVPH
jgi:hypothetical protein